MHCKRKVVCVASKCEKYEWQYVLREEARHLFGNKEKAQQTLGFVNRIIYLYNRVNIKPCAPCCTLTS